MTREEWVEIADRGTSDMGDMVGDILSDWKTSEDALRQLLEKSAYYVDSMTCPSVKRENEKWTHSELCQKISSVLGVER